MQEIQSFYVWRESLELAKHLAQICEEFSDGEKNVLVWHLRQAVVEIPATIATDIKLGRAATMEPVIKLATELELVHRIYPAIDTDGAPAKLTALIERMESDRFLERVVESADNAADEIPVGVQSEPSVDIAGEPDAVTPKEEPSPQPPVQPRVLNITTEDSDTAANQE
jgi:hypothetical protein